MGRPFFVHRPIVFSSKVPMPVSISVSSRGIVELVIEVLVPKELHRRSVPPECLLHLHGFRDPDILVDVAVDQQNRHLDLGCVSKR